MPNEASLVQTSSADDSINTEIINHDSGVYDSEYIITPLENEIENVLQNLYEYIRQYIQPNDMFQINIENNTINMFKIFVNPDNDKVWSGKDLSKSIFASLNSFVYSFLESDQVTELSDISFSFSRIRRISGAGAGSGVTKRNNCISIISEDLCLPRCILVGIAVQNPTYLFKLFNKNISDLHMKYIRKGDKSNHPQQRQYAMALCKLLGISKTDNYDKNDISLFSQKLNLDINIFQALNERDISAPICQFEAPDKLKSFEINII